MLLQPIGHIRSTLTVRKNAPRQGDEGAPDAWLDLDAGVTVGLRGVQVGDALWILRWLHEAVRDVLLVHPRGRTERPAVGVFASRSPDRPNPIGLHQVVVREIADASLRIGPIEAIDGTPVVDIKPVIGPPDTR